MREETMKAEVYAESQERQLRSDWSTWTLLIWKMEMQTEEPDGEWNLQSRNKCREISIYFNVFQKKLLILNLCCVHVTPNSDLIIKSQVTFKIKEKGTTRSLQNKLISGLLIMIHSHFSPQLKSTLWLMYGAG